MRADHTAVACPRHFSASGNLCNIGLRLRGDDKEQRNRRVNRAMGSERRVTGVGADSNP